MSHYAVAVFLDPNGKNLEDLLAPFDEGLHVPHYIKGRHNCESSQ